MTLAIPQKSFKKHAPSMDRLSIFAAADLIRAAEEEALRLYHEGHIAGTVHTCLGQELCQMAVVRALTPKDHVLSNHRNHGHLLAYSGDIHGFFAELTGRAGALCGGRGGSQHMAVGNFHSNGVQGGMSAIGTGFALAAKLSRDDAIVAVMLGDGTLGEGLVYEAMNLAALWSLPVLFVIEANGIAQTTPTPLALSGDILERGEAFGLTAWRISDRAPDFIESIEDIVSEVRITRRAHYLVIDTARLGPHSKGDDQRPKAELDLIKAQDPLLALRDRLPAAETAAIEERNRALIRQIAEEVLSRSPAQPKVAIVQTRTAPKLPVPTGPCGTVRESLNAALRRLLVAHGNVVLLGEDLHDPYGGAFKVSAGLSTAFPARVLSTPISEAAITGTATGLALAGYRPISEIMFADFLSLCIDQLYNHAVKLGPIKGGEALSMVIRTASGGRRGYGPTHSQSPEGLVASIPGLTVVAPHHRVDAGWLLEVAVLNASGPVLFFEHKLLYGATIEQGDYQPLPANLPSGLDALFPTMGRLKTAPDLIILSYGGMLKEAEAAARRLEEDEELTVEILAPTLLSPFPAAAVIERVKNCGRILIAEEGPKAFGIGAEIAALLLESGVPARLRRVGSEAVIIPAARHLEREALPDADAIVSAALALLLGGQEA